MKLSHLLNKDLILCDEEINSAEKLYERVSTVISNKYKIPYDEVSDAFIKRDKLGYVVFPDGSVIPHGRIDNFDDLIIVIVKTKKSIPISSGYADLFYCILTSNAGSNQYLKTLAAFSKISSFHANEIRKCKNAEEIMSFIESLNIGLDKIVKVKDIISHEVQTAKLNDKITDIADIMKKHNIIFLPVVDDQGLYIGKIDILDIIRIAFPEYTMMMTDISFLNNLRAFEDYHEEEQDKIVKDLYSKAETKIINQNDCVIELGYMFVKKGWHHVTVVDDDNKVVSVISTRSFLNNILRA